MRDASEMNGNVADDDALLREDMVEGDSGGMKPPDMDEKRNGYVDRGGDFTYLH